MSSNFENLPEEKKKRILDACIEEFALNGYDKASTNVIVKNADISKGLLFHYFKNKRNLFLYIFDHCVNLLVDSYYSARQNEPKDVFERMVWVSIYKIKMAHKNPLINKLIFKAIYNTPEELKEELTEKYTSMYAKYMPTFLEGIDTSKFRKDIKPEKAIEFITICMDGIANKYLQKYKNMSADELMKDLEKIMEEYNEYMDILKNGLYPRL